MMTSRVPPCPSQALALLDLNIILKANQESREAVENKVDHLKIDLSLLQQDLCKVTDRASEADACISITEDELTTLKCQISKLMSSVGTLRKRAKDAENWARRINLHLDGLPENLEDSELATALEHCCPNSEHPVRPYGDSNCLR
ncbi:hypothetical protein NDU88_005334 [Pleurodeles waltl]|uniref:Uncharacterized protein n=1 Tax=Pleurodeles waltl TaxID=8319 RepID=A0AAV7PHS2_PLEWA|nr:hypothetical protein NDU88_005332 [Pleurodeles waltl]KAJ1126928.1 hypothetical protein NDU88_005334 [Pleurodeles waltl]